MQTRNYSLDLTLQSIKSNNSINNNNNTINSINLIGVSDLDSRKSTTSNIFVLNNIKDNYSTNSISIS